MNATTRHEVLRWAANLRATLTENPHTELPDTTCSDQPQPYADAFAVVCCLISGAMALGLALVILS